MATIEKLIKAFEGLKVFQPNAQTAEDSKKKEQNAPTKKDKILHCNVVADCMCASNMRNITDFPKFLGIAMEAFLTLCNDQESDVRMVADECLNRTIKVLLETNLGRLQVELYKELKKNGPSRSLRAALWRFADMCHLIRPQKCRPYIVNLLPCIARICRREEEAVQETLSAAMPKICSALMPFANDTEVKALLKSFLPNLHSTSAVCRRMSASGLALICQHSRAPVSFFNYLVGVLLEMILPVDDEHDVSVLLGVILCLRHIIPHLAETVNKDQGLKDSFGCRESEAELAIGEEQVIKILQALLHYSGHSDHNVVTASLESLQQLLRTPPPSLRKRLLTCGSISKSHIFRQDSKGDEQARILQALLHYSGHSDHNVVTASLESLQQLLRTPPPSLRKRLLTCGSISKSHIFRQDSKGDEQARVESVVDLVTMSDDTGLMEDADAGEKNSAPSIVSTGSDTSAFVSDLSSSSIERSGVSINNEATVSEEAEWGDNIVVMTDGTDYSGLEIGDLNEDRSEISGTSGMSHSDSMETLQSLRSSSPRQQGLPQLIPGHDMNGNPQIAPDPGEDDEFQPPPSPGVMNNEPVEQIPIEPDSLKEDEVPLLFYLRLLSKRFLLTGVTDGLVPDKQVRVSLKSLALGCVACTLALCPRLFLFKLCPQASGEGSDQNLQDITLYASHSDQQLKAQTSLIIGSFIKAALVEGRGDFHRWIVEHLPKGQTVMSLESLLKILVDTLEDESAVAVRASLMGLQLCLGSLLDSSSGCQGLEVLLDLLHVKANPYWLVKVELLELISSLNFKVISYLEVISPDIVRGDHNYLGRLSLQEHCLQDIVLHLLGDEDGRVRTAASSAICRLVPKLHFASDSPQQDAVVSVAADQTQALLSPIMQPLIGGNQLPPLVQGLIQPYLYDILAEVCPASESALSRVVQMLLQLLLVSQTRHMTNGCCQALCHLSEQYLVTQYASAWGCGPAMCISPKESKEKPGMRRPPTRSLSASSMEELTSTAGGGPLPIVLSLMLSSQAGLELTTHQDLLLLAGNMIAGAAYKDLRPYEETAKKSGTGDDGNWAAVSDRLIVPMIEQLFTHTARLLCACTHAIEETVPGPPQAKPILPSLPNASTLSPVRRKMKGDKDVGSPTPGGSPDTKGGQKTPVKDLKEGEKEKNKRDGVGVFYNIPQYMKLFDIIRGSYSNFKTSLDLTSSDKFCTMLKAVLTVLSQLLEIATLYDVGKVTEELLGYLKVTMSLEPTWTVQCVQQLLKALFGTNLASQWDPNSQSTASLVGDLNSRSTVGATPGIYYHCLNKPYSQLAHCLVGAACRATLPADEAHSSLLWLKQRVDKKLPAILKPTSQVDKSVIGSYIRLFEPLVIKALKQYTVTSSLELQCQVLALLAQLIQLRVNYCLLDSDQIFIGFIIKQFEFIEEGQIRNSEMLVPYIFQFLVMLSYEKFHSKSIIDMPRIIHRCDGIMASGLQPTTHAIPALKPVVYDLFLLRGTVKSEVGKDLETQREVVVSMLLRLVQYYQALDMFVLVLQQCHRESEERWKRLSRQVMDVVLPAMAKQQVNLDNQEGLDTLHRLFESVSPSVFRPVDFLLKALLAPPHNVNDVVCLQKWMCLVLTIIRVLISQSKEEVILARLSELQLHVGLIRGSSQGEQGTANSVLELLRNLAPEETLAWFLLQVIGKCSEMLDAETAQLSPGNLGGLDRECKYRFLLQQTLHLLLYITHMFQSGLFRRLATAAMRLLQLESPACMYSVGEINSHMVGVSSVCPSLTLHWCNVLILLNFDDRSLWTSLVERQPTYLKIGTRGIYIPNSEDGESGSQQQRLSQSCNLEILRRGGLILFCDYVCENLSDAEHMTWLIINHVCDLILLSQESPVQDFIGAIHRNPAASSLFIQAIHARGDRITKPSMVKRTLKCLDAIHTSQSGSLIALLIDKFLNSHQLAVTRMTDTIVCQRLEALLGESVEEISKQLPKEDIEKLLQFLKSNGLIQRHQHLASLLSKLGLAAGSTAVAKVSPEKSHPLSLSPVDVASITIDKEFYLSIVKEQSFQTSPRARECAFLLQRLEYPDILALTMTKEFSLAVLQECVSLGAFRSVLRFNRDVEFQGEIVQPGQHKEPTLDPLFQAAYLTMFRHINNIVGQLPVPHQSLSFLDPTPPSCLHYMDRLEELFSDHHWMEANFSLSSALVRYMVALTHFPWKAQLPAEAHRDVVAFSVICLEMICWSLSRETLPESAHLESCLSCVALVLQEPNLHALLSRQEHATWVCSIVGAVYQLVASMVVLPGEQVANIFQDDRRDEGDEDDTSLSTSLVHACDEISELIHCLQTRLDPSSEQHSKLPPFLASLCRNIVVGVSRLPVINSYARTPPLVWRLGWSPTPMGDMPTCLPPLPVEYLQEKDVLKEFACRINHLGWVNRQQFEESWMSLLGVLNPVSHMGHDLSPEEEIEQSQGMVMAVKAITSLLLQASLVPHSGNPSNSSYEVRPRDKPLAFLHTRCGKKLSVIRGLIEQEIISLCASRPDRSVPQAYCGRSSDKNSFNLYDGNLEREMGSEEFGLGQISVESTWSLVGSLEAIAVASDTTDSLDSHAGQVDQVANSPSSASTGSGGIGKLASARSVNHCGLDVHSCLQFLLELYGAWLHIDNSPKPPLMLINSVLKSMLCLSDLFMEREQFEFMQDILLDLLKAHPGEDELSSQYIVAGLCKATAVVGTEALVTERVVKLVESCLKSTHLPTKISALHGSLYLLEGGVSELNTTLLPFLTDFLAKHLAIVSQACFISNQLVVTMWATTFYIIENFSSEIKDTDFTSKIMQLIVTTVSGNEETVSTSVFLTVMKGTERLLLTDVLPQSDTETIIKLSMDRLCLPNPQRALAALGLMFTCMYSGKSSDQYSPRPREEQLFGDDDFQPIHQDPDSLILAMERVTVLFDRIKKGYPYEARVITRLLPAFLADFFPAQDIMNKVIGEFLSAHQPYPNLIAKVVFQVFSNLHQQQQQGLVREWVMLSLSNFTQRSPQAMAMWSLALFFISASTNFWLRALFPHVLGRMGHMELMDRKLFCLCALDFYRQLTDESHKRAFVSTFQTIAAPDSPYGDLVQCLPPAL
ncbi:huntingtin-like [Plakobranchus ocellatus]|uniref:Huntingtin-like n=1 Tax=Plakobranchus ocellatus TaxID=259542 RepID=A0AAV4D1I7_9GAST|nr:huntingtin-like [Plakobranchus ocellatus]